MKNVTNNESGFAQIIAALVVTVAVGVIAFLVLSSSAPFKSSVFSQLFPKPASHAAGNVYYVSKNGNNADGTSWATA